MCGFVFAYAKAKGGLPSGDRLAAMDAALRHRGPDEHGRAAFGSAAMAHRRLRIIDLEGSQQPYVNRDRTVWLVFNGEIYNFREIGAELAAKGHQLSGRSDTEVLMAAYLEWGDACVDRLNGMFAFAFYDAREERVFAARDRFGEKPLYALETADAVYLASEMNSLLAGQIVAPVVDRTALYAYFTCKYNFGPRTIFEGVRRVAPGHRLVIEAGRVQETAYWTPPAPSGAIDDEDEAARLALDLLRDSVRQRLVSDVPIGFFLSGGLDSSAIVALASELTTSRLETFGIGFEQERYDETRHQRFVAKRFGANHHEIVLKPESIDIIEDLAWHLDEPFADSAALPLWFLAKHARRHVVVALSGDGGDEMFAGYDVYRGYKLSERIGRLPAFLRHAALAALRQWPSRNVETRSRLERLQRNIADTAISPRDRFIAKQQTAFRRDGLRDISPLLASYCSHAQDQELFTQLFGKGLGDLEAMAYWQQTASLPDDMLFKTDRMSMAHSLEVRCPFLDHRIAELMNQVSFAAKLGGGRTKNILKKAMKGHFPAAFIHRPKQGLNLPLAAWFKEELSAYARSRLLRRGAIMPHVVARERIEHLLEQHESLAKDWSGALWTMLIFEIWCTRRGLGPEILGVTLSREAATAETMALAG